MKKWVIPLVFLICLTGCNASSEIERGMALRSALLKGNACRFQVAITADYPDSCHRFTLDCQFDSEGNMAFSVCEPESISGITGTVAEERGTLTFDDTVLYFELMTDDQISPVTAPWILMKTLRSGYLTSACTEDDQLRLTIDDSYEEDALKLDIWLSSTDQPVYAEILHGGRRILSMEIAEFGIV